jgi:hypothetical protein
LREMRFRPGIGTVRSPGVAQARPQRQVHVQYGAPGCDGQQVQCGLGKYSRYRKNPLPQVQVQAGNPDRFCSRWSRRLGAWRRLPSRKDRAGAGRKGCADQGRLQCGAARHGGHHFTRAAGCAWPWQGRHRAPPGKSAAPHAQNAPVHMHGNRAKSCGNLQKSSAGLKSTEVFWRRAGRSSCGGQVAVGPRAAARSPVAGGGAGGGAHFHRV